MKFLNYLASDRSNRLLLIVIVILVNLVSLNWYFRADLTEGDTYSLSPVSKQTIESIGEPLTVTVFFSRDLPAPYNGVSRYLKDLLAEYDSLGNRNFHYQFVDMESDQGHSVADSYGIRSVQVQEVRSDEFQSRNVYMSLAISYGSSVEQLQDLTGTEGLEYRITTTISRLVGTVSAAAALKENVETTLYYSPSLADFNIKGFSDLEKIVKTAVASVNDENNGILDLSVQKVETDAEATSLGEQYGFQRIGYKDTNDPNHTREATVGMVMKLGDRFQTIPIDLSRQIFGGYTLSGLSNLSDRIGDALGGLLNENPPVGYVTGHGERGLEDSQQGAAVFRALNSDLYEFKELNLKQDEIPLGISTLVINGPKSTFSQKELYALDQFLMRGGSLMVFLDPYQIIQPQQNGQPVPPSYLPIDSGLVPLLKKYGIDVPRNYVLDKKSYKTQQQYGGMQLYHVPILAKQSLNQKNPITRNLGQVVFFATSEVKPAKDVPDGVDISVLAHSSDEAWIMEGKIDLSPRGMYPPAEQDLAQYPLLVLAEGYFPSYFEKNPAADSPADGVNSSSHIKKSIRRGKVLVAGTSEIAGPQLLDPQGKSPNSILIQNMLDYANGNEELPLVRSKGLDMMPLGDTSPRYRAFVKGFAMAVLPLLVIAVGLLIWRMRESRRRSIRRMFVPAAGSRGGPESKEASKRTQKSGGDRKKEGAE